ncbi:MAG: ABC transporter ATP-binding protein [Lentisphaeria bacterium]|nr:ABC transporter ATP-binding protein [Lentisphaeria bacterium]
MSEILYHLEGVCRDFRLEKGVVHVLSGLSLDIPEGGWCALVGRSGSGKTTLLQLLGGLDRPTSGTILFRGEDLGRMSSGKLTAVRRKEFGFVFQSYHLLPELNALENAALPALGWFDNRAEAYERAKRLLCDFGLAARLTHRPQDLSGGDQQRVAIARALIHNPPVILADEPTGNLDEASARTVVEIFRKLHRDEHKTIVMVTHDNAIADLGTMKHRLN